MTRRDESGPIVREDSGATRRGAGVRPARRLAAIFAAVLGVLILAPASWPAQPNAPAEIQALIQAGKYADAEKRARVLLREAEQAHGRESVEVAEILDQLTESMIRGGKAGEAEAREFCDRAIRIKEKTVGPDDPRYAASLYELGYLLYVNGDYSQAKPPLERSLAIREATLGKNDPSVASSLLLLGAISSDSGDHAAARPLLERSLAIREGAFGPNSTQVAEGLTAIGGLLVRLGDFSTSVPIQERALRIWEEQWGPEHPKVGTCVNNLGAVLYFTGDYSGALSYYQRARDIRIKSLGPVHELVANSTVWIGTNLAALGRVREARAEYEQAMTVQNVRFGKDSPEVGTTLTLLGFLYLQSGNYLKAKPILERAAANLERGLGGDNPDFAEALGALATAIAATGDFKGAKDMYERALRIRERSLGADHPEVGLMLTQYSRVLAASGEDSLAMEIALHAEEVSREHVRLTSRVLPERQSLGYAAARPAGGRVALSILASRPGFPAGASSRVWDSLIRSRMVILDQMASRTRAVVESGDSATSQLAQEFSAARRRLANLLVAGPNGESPKSYRATVERTRQEAERAERALAQSSLSLRREQAQDRIGLPEVVAALSVKSALVAYAIAGDSSSLAYVAFVLRGGESLATFVPIGSAVKVQAAVSRWLADVSHGGAGATAGPKQREAASRLSGAAMSRVIWEPVAAHLAGAKRIFIVPDGAVSLVNFAALPVGRDRYLVETGLICHYLSAERDLVADATPTPNGEGLLVFGNPAFNSGPSSRPSGRPPGSVSDRSVPGREEVASTYRGAEPDCGDFKSLRFPPLPKTGLEAREVADLWNKPNQTVVLTGVAASEAAFKAGAPGSRVVHLATHGFFLGEGCQTVSGATRGIGGVAQAGAQPKRPAPSPQSGNPLLLSGLALAGANQRASAGLDDEDGVLTAEEIAALNLSGVEWAVLSACDTGKGKVQAGEGVLGLRRAFQVAGARTIIMSLWAVEDESARQWMKVLYEGRVVEGLETADAVAKADLTVLRERRAQARSTDPFYWAAFVAAGDWK